MNTESNDNTSIQTPNAAPLVLSDDEMKRIKARMADHYKNTYGVDINNTTLEGLFVIMVYHILEMQEKVIKNSVPMELRKHGDKEQIFVDNNKFAEL